MSRVPLHDLIIVLPGIMGSVLEKKGEEIWAPSYRFASQLLKKSGGSLAGLEWRGGFSDSGNGGVVASRIFDQFVIVPGFFKKDLKRDFYSDLEEAITTYFRVDHIAPGEGHPVLLEFPYDWRQDNRVSAQQLKKFVDQKLGEFREKTKDKSARVILIGHSMGGLVGRYYVEALGGKKDCRSLITLGTPHQGAAAALDYLTNGRTIVRADLTNAIRSFPSLYQLLPTYNSVGVNGKYYNISEVDDLPHVNYDWVKNGADFHKEIYAKAKEEATNYQSAESEIDFELHPCVGVSQPTLQTVLFEKGKVIPSYTAPEHIFGSLTHGDGTVPKFSAIPKDKLGSRHHLFYSGTHACLPGHPSIIDQVLHQIEQMQNFRIGPIRGHESFKVRPSLSLHMQDVYAEDQHVEININTNISDENCQHLIKIWDLSSSKLLERQKIPTTGQDKLVIKDLPEGAFKVEVKVLSEDTTPPDPVSDIFMVS